MPRLSRHPRLASRRRAAARVPCAGRAFTLLELVLALLVIATIMAIAVPSMRGFNRGQKLGNTAADFLSTLQWARTQAVASGAVYRFELDVAAGRYRVTIQDGDEFAPLNSSLAGPFQLPEGYRMQFERQTDPARAGTAAWGATSAGGTSAGRLGAGSGTGSRFGGGSRTGLGSGSRSGRGGGGTGTAVAWAGSDYVDFFPNGRADPARVRIVDDHGDVAVIECPSPAEGFRILDSSQEAAR